IKKEILPYIKNSNVVFNGIETYYDLLKEKHFIKNKGEASIKSSIANFTGVSLPADRKIIPDSVSIRYNALLLDKSLFTFKDNKIILTKNIKCREAQVCEKKRVEFIPRTLDKDKSLEYSAPMRGNYLNIVENYYTIFEKGVRFFDDIGKVIINYTVDRHEIRVIENNSTQPLRIVDLGHKDIIPSTLKCNGIIDDTFLILSEPLMPNNSIEIEYNRLISLNKEVEDVKEVILIDDERDTLKASFITVTKGSKLLENFSLKIQDMPSNKVVINNIIQSFNKYYIKNDLRGYCKIGNKWIKVVSCTKYDDTYYEVEFNESFTNPIECDIYNINNLQWNKLEYESFKDNTIKINKLFPVTTLFEDELGNVYQMIKSTKDELILDCSINGKELSYSNRILLDPIHSFELQNICYEIIDARINGVNVAPQVLNNIYYSNTICPKDILDLEYKCNWFIKLKRDDCIYITYTYLTEIDYPIVAEYDEETISYNYILEGDERYLARILIYYLFNENNNELKDILNFLYSSVENQIIFLESIQNMRSLQNHIDLLDDERYGIKGRLNLLNHYKSQKDIKDKFINNFLREI
ncbi:MAG: hypothetical protein WC783_02590, partial [Candidatus Paceibacterota bacterium]